MATAEQVTTLIELMQQQMTLLQQRETGSAPGTKSKKPDRPVINADIDDREWALFLDTWSRYKGWIGVTDASKIRMELRAACSTEVNKMLFEFVGPATLDECTEDDLLNHIKSIAVKQVHHEVHQMNFHLMRQDEGESISRYTARLKAQACLCKFEVPSGTTTISYADQMVAQRLVSGLHNRDHQRKVLAEAATLTSLEAKVKRLQLLETTDESASILHGIAAPKPSEAAAQRSQYKRDQGSSKVKTNVPAAEGTGSAPDGVRCKGCGGPQHPGGRTSCHAFKKKCFNCKRKGHLSTVCEKEPSRSASAGDNGDDQDDEVLPNVPSDASVSFSFAAQDFRPSEKHDGWS